MLHRPEVAHERLAGSDRDDAAVVLPDAVEQGGDELSPFERRWLPVPEVTEIPEERFGLGERRVDRRRVAGELFLDCLPLHDVLVLGEVAEDVEVAEPVKLCVQLAAAGGVVAAEALLADFARFWNEEPSPLERRKLISTLLDRVWQDGGTIVAVRPRQPFVRYFRTMQRLNTPPRGRGVNSGSDGTRTRDLRRDRPAF